MKAGVTGRAGTEKANGMRAFWGGSTDGGAERNGEAVCREKEDE